MTIPPVNTVILPYLWHFIPLSPQNLLIKPKTYSFLLSNLSPFQISILSPIKQSNMALTDRAVNL